LRFETPACFDKCHSSKVNKYETELYRIKRVTKKQTLRIKPVLISIHETNYTKQVV
jgi:hypothetical protein